MGKDINQTKLQMLALQYHLKKKDVPKKYLSELNRKFNIPSARDRINQYVTPADYTSDMVNHRESDERGQMLEDALNVSFGNDD